MDMPKCYLMRFYDEELWTDLLTVCKARNWKIRHAVTAALTAWIAAQKKSLPK